MDSLIWAIHQGCPGQKHIVTTWHGLTPCCSASGGICLESWGTLVALAGWALQIHILVSVCMGLRRAVSCVQETCRCSTKGHGLVGNISSRQADGLDHLGGPLQPLSFYDAMIHSLLRPQDHLYVYFPWGRAFSRDFISQPKSFPIGQCSISSTCSKVVKNAFTFFCEGRSPDIQEK